MTSGWNVDKSFILLKHLIYYSTVSAKVTHTYKFVYLGNSSMTTTSDKWTDGKAYEMYVGRWSRRIGKQFLSLLEPNANSNWIDVGCGTGALTSEILRNCSPQTVIGVDPSSDFLSIATQQINDARVEFRQGTGQELPIGDGEADYAVSGFVLNFLENHQSSIKELTRALKPGGTVAAYVWDYAGHVQFIRHFWDAAVSVRSEAVEKDEGVRFPICRPAPLKELFESAGLLDVAVDAVDIATPFENFDDYWKPFLSGVGPAPGYCASLEEGTRAQIKKRLQESLPIDKDGMILLAARAWAVKGVCA